MNKLLLNVIEKVNKNDIEESKDLISSLNKMMTLKKELQESYFDQMKARDFSIIKSGVVFPEYPNLDELGAVLDDPECRLYLNAVIAFLLAHSDVVKPLDEITRSFNSSLTELKAVIQEPFQGYRDISAYSGEGEH